MGMLPRARRSDLRIRPHRAGDLGWVLSMHEEQYPYGPVFVALVARLLGDFSETYDPAWERLFIAELDGERVGSAGLFRDGDRARFRVLMVHPDARGRGVGAMLLGRCLDFARGRGYREVVLSTEGALDSARKLYRGHGFRLISEHEHHGWAEPVQIQEWSLSFEQADAGGVAGDLS